MRLNKQHNPIISNNWVAVKELNLSYYIGEALLFTISIYIYICMYIYIYVCIYIYTHYS